MQRRRWASQVGAATGGNDHERHRAPYSRPRAKGLIQKRSTVPYSTAAELRKRTVELVGRPRQPKGLPISSWRREDDVSGFALSHARRHMGRASAADRVRMDVAVAQCRCDVRTSASDRGATRRPSGVCLQFLDELADHAHAQDVDLRGARDFFGLIAVMRHDVPRVGGTSISPNVRWLPSRDIMNVKTRVWSALHRHREQIEHQRGVLFKRLRNAERLVDDGQSGRVLGLGF